MNPDHDEAKKWAEEMLRLDSVSPLGKTGNTAACYLDAMARLDKATELLEEYASVKRAGVGTGLLARTRLFLAAERK